MQQKSLSIEQMLKGTTPIHIAKHNFKNFKEAKHWAKTHMVGTYKNEHTHQDIRVAKITIDKYLSESAIKKSVSIDAHLSALQKLDELIITSILKETKNDRHEDHNIKEIQRLYGAP